MWGEATALVHVKHEGIAVGVEAFDVITSMILYFRKYESMTEVARIS